MAIHSSGTRPLTPAARIGRAAARIAADRCRQDIGADLAGNRPFGVVAHGDTGIPARWSPPAGRAVGQYQFGVHIEMEELQVAERLGDPDPGDLWPCRENATAELLSILRVADGSGRRSAPSGDLAQRLEDPAESSAHRHSRAVQGQRRIAPGFNPYNLSRSSRPPVRVLKQGVDHHVADEEDSLRRHPSRSSCGRRCGRW